jgi:hypothetical protein
MELDISIEVEDAYINRFKFITFLPLLAINQFKLSLN